MDHFGINLKVKTGSFWLNTAVEQFLSSSFCNIGDVLPWVEEIKSYHPYYEIARYETFLLVLNKVSYCHIEFFFHSHPFHIRKDRTQIELFHCSTI